MTKQSVIAHDSAHKHVSGEAVYIDDMVEPDGLAHAYLGLSEVAHGEISKLDLKPVLEAPGVIGVLTLNDIPGHNDISPTGKNDEPVFAAKVEFHGQPIFAVIADTRNNARHAARLAKVKYKAEPHHVDVVAAADAGMPFVTEPLTLKRGNASAALRKAENRITADMRIGGQDHFYLEGHIAPISNA